MESDGPVSTVLSWSGGKDAAFALGRLGADPDAAVVELLTTVNADRDRVSMHGVRRSLLERQAAALDLPVTCIDLPESVGNDGYERRLREALSGYAARGIDRIAFADLHLEDVRAYRERTLEGTGVEGVWPLWGRETAALAEAVLEAGFRATVVCVDGSALDRSFVGRSFDRAFLADLPDGVDPCGEGGEFHTFVRDGPPFSTPVAVERGERVTREVGGTPFHYRDLVATGR